MVLNWRQATIDLLGAAPEGARKYVKESDGPVDALIYLVTLFGAGMWAEKAEYLVTIRPGVVFLRDYIEGELLRRATPYVGGVQ